MKKTSILWIMMDLIFLIVFNTIYFLAGAERYGTSAWLSYGFIHFSYLMLLLTPYLTKKTSTHAAVLGFAISSVSSAYFLAELVIGSIIILINPEGFKVVLVLHMIITAIYLVVLLSNMIANENTADSLERHEVELKYVKECSAQLQLLMNTVSDKQLKKAIERAYDVIHASQVHSNIAVRNIELEVINLISKLKAEALIVPEQATMTANQIVLLAEERNVQLKLSN